MDFDLNMVYCIIQNYPVTWEWDEADWLDPLIGIDVNIVIGLRFPDFGNNVSQWVILDPNLGKTFNLIIYC